jgi:F-type H+-transporting ATPase subunit b
MRNKLPLFILAAFGTLGMIAQTALAQAEPVEHAAGAAAEHAAPGLFEGTLYQSVSAIIVFLIVLTILKKTAWGPMLAALKDREDKIREDLAAAEKAANDARATLEDYRKQLATAGEEGRKLIEQARNDAQRVANQLREQTASEITILKQRAEADIRAAKETALAEVYEQTANLATSVAGKILRRQITADDQQALVRESLAELNKPASKN